MDPNHGSRILRFDRPENETPTAPDASTSPESGAKLAPNRRNGRSRKTVQGGLREVTIQTPRDRDGTFEPQLIGKHQRRMPGFDEKILALYAKGMTPAISITRQIVDPGRFV